MPERKFRFSGKMWLHPGVGGWHFVTLSTSLSRRIKRFVKDDTAAWGSIRLTVQVCDHRWETSIFPDKERGAYLLPIRKAVRSKLELSADSVVRGELHIECDEPVFL